MKYKLTVAIAFTVLFLVYACDEKYEPVDNKDALVKYEPIDTTFFAGDKDSCTYFDYEPDIMISIRYLNTGYFQYSQSFDIDEDGIDDFALVINGYKDTSKMTSNYWKTISLKPLLEYYLANGHVEYVNDTLNGGYGGWISDSNFSVDAMLFGDTLATKHYDYDYGQDGFQMLEIGYNYDLNSHDTCCGDWNIWGTDRYIAFQKYDSDIKVGWMRLEMRADTDLIILKDCAIQKFSEKHN